MNFAVQLAMGIRRSNALDLRLVVQRLERTLEARILL